MPINATFGTRKKRKEKKINKRKEIKEKKKSIAAIADFFCDYDFFER